MIPAGAYDAFLPDALVGARAQRAWTPADGALPALYLSHGAPPLFDDGPWLRQLFDWASYHDRAPGMPYAHPTPDHYIPLFVTLGAADHPDHPVETTIDGYMMGFSKRSFQTTA